MVLSINAVNYSPSLDVNFKRRPPVPKCLELVYFDPFACSNSDDPASDDPAAEQQKVVQGLYDKCVQTNQATMRD